VTKQLLIIRPKTPGDDWTSKFTFDASCKIASKARQKGWQVTELEGNAANRTMVENCIKKEKPNLIIHYGHGRLDSLWGQRDDEKESVLSSGLFDGNVHLLSSSVVSTVSCFSACIWGLGGCAAAANKSAKAYMGYDIPICCNFDYQKYFARAANAANYALLEGKTFQEAKDIGYKKYTDEYNKLLALNDPYVQLFVAPFMLLNRDHLKLIP
jgi:hypothetical protein